MLLAWSCVETGEFFCFLGCCGSAVLSLAKPWCASSHVKVARRHGEHLQAGLLRYLVLVCCGVVMAIVFSSSGWSILWLHKGRKMQRVVPRYLQKQWWGPLPALHRCHLVFARCGERLGSLLPSRSRKQPAESQGVLFVCTEMLQESQADGRELHYSRSAEVVSSHLFSWLLWQKSRFPWF